MISRNFLDKKGVVSVLEPHFDHLINAINCAMMLYRDRFSKSSYLLSARSRASIMHDLIINEIASVFEDVEEIALKESMGLHYLIVDGIVFLRVKKLGDRLTASNNNTQQVELWNLQELIERESAQIPLPFDFLPQPLVINENFVNINLGYYTNEEHTMIDGLYLICPNGHKLNLWCLKFYDRRFENSSIIDFPSPPPESPKPPKVELSDEQKKIVEDKKKTKKEE